MGIITDSLHTDVVVEAIPGCSPRIYVNDPGVNTSDYVINDPMALTHFTDKEHVRIFTEFSEFLLWVQINNVQVLRTVCTP